MLYFSDYTYREVAIELAMELQNELPKSKYIINFGRGRNKLINLLHSS